jgi:hypothetical protein
VLLLLLLPLLLSLAAADSCCCGVVNSQQCFYCLLCNMQSIPATRSMNMAVTRICKHADFCLLVATSTQGEVIGEVRQRWHLWRRNYDLYLGRRQFAAINGGFLAWEFELKDAQNNTLALIDRCVRCGWGVVNVYM